MPTPRVSSLIQSGLSTRSASPPYELNNFLMTTLKTGGRVEQDLQALLRREEASLCSYWEKLHRSSPASRVELMKGAVACGFVGRAESLQ